MADCAAAAVTDADLIMLCVPVGAMRTVGEAIVAELPAGAVVSDVGSVKGSVLDDLRAVLPKGTAIVPGHPVAGTEHSGPDAGRSEEHTSELQSLMRITSAVFC